MGGNAARKLAQLGAAALLPQKVNGVWHKAAVSPLAAARLRKQAILEGREWPHDKPATEKKPVWCKGKKHDKQKVHRLANIQKNMEDMPKRVEQYRESLKMKDIPLLDRLLMTTKELKEKARGK